MLDLGRLEAALDGDLLAPGSPGYDAARRPAFARYEAVRPRAVVRCASPDDVASTIAFARSTGLPAVPRAGGHCFAGRSSTEGLLLDLGRLNPIAFGPDNRATIGAGARLARVYDALHERSRTVPAGCGGTVGIAGLTLGGGLGLLGRAHGLTSDALVGAQVVLADGRLVECGADEEPELFWALRGAGGGQFGVVTALTFATVDEPCAARFELGWPEEAVAAVIAGWQRWAPDAPDAITANLRVVAEPGRPLHAVVYGAALGTGPALSGRLDGLVDAVGSRPETCTGEELAFRDLKRTLADLEDGGPLATTSRSEFFAEPLPAGAIVTLLDELVDEPHGRRELDFIALGGAYNRVAPDATAFVHRTEQFLLQHGTEENRVEDAGWVDRSWSIAHAHGSGRVYPNFPDPALTDWAEAYHGGNRARLAAVKQTYDPDRFFDFPQCV